MQNDVDAWLEFAERDLRAAKVMLAGEIYTHGCLYAQQVIEKALKGLILHKGKRIPKIHDLLDLLELAEEPSLAGFAEELKLINSYYLPVRYPDTLSGTGEGFEPSRRDAESAVASAEGFLNRTINIVRPGPDASRGALRI